MVVTPGQANILAGSTVRLAATVTGAGPVPQAVTWTLRCRAGCGAARSGGDFGSLTAGQYQAPRDNPGAVEVEVQAASAVSGLVTGTSTIRVSPTSSSVSPVTPAVVIGGQLQLHWEWNGVQDPPATWSCKLGTIDAAGHYAAPATFAVPPYMWPLEVSNRLSLQVAGGGPTLVVTVQLLFRTPVITGLSGPAAPGGTLTVLGTDLVGGPTGHVTTYAVFSDGAGGEISAPMVATANLATVVVPGGVASGPLRVEIRSASVPTAISNPVNFEREGRIRLRADRAELTASESTALRTAILGVPGPLPITFETDLGIMAGNVYTAPATVAAGDSANVRACVTGTSTCAGLSLTLRPVRFEPGIALVAPGGSLQLSALAGGAPAALTYSLAAGGGAVTTGGSYLAPALPGDAGPAWLLASDGATSWPVQVGVAGAVPGLLNRMVEPAPVRSSALTAGVPWGAVAQSVAVSGPRAYLLQAPAAGGTAPWIDVFDIADPVRPAWLGALEARDGATGRLLVSNGLLLLATERWVPGLATVRSVDAYDLSGAWPVSAGAIQQSYPSGTAVFPMTVEAGTLHVFGALSPTDTAVELRSYSITGGTFSAPVVNVLPLPAWNTRFVSSLTGAVSSGRAYVSYRTLGDHLAAFDLSVSPARLLGTTDTSYPYPFAVVGRHLLLNSQCLDLVPELPISIPCTTERTEYAALARDGARLVSPGLSLDDYSIPASPHRVATVDGGGAPGALIGGLYLSPEGPGGLAIYDLGREGGARSLGTTSDPTGYGMYTALASALRPPYLYAAGRGLTVWDSSSSPPTPRGTTSLAAYTYAASATPDLLLLGTTSALQVWSLLDPAAPAPLGNLAADVTAVEVNGTVAWVGTRAGDLLAVSLQAPAAPVLLGRIPLGATPRAVRVLPGGRLAVALVTADWISGDLAVVDGSDPTAPVLLGAAGLGAPTLDVALSGSVAAVVTTGALITLDLAVPASPTPLAAVAIPPSTATDGYGNPVSAAQVRWSGALAWVSVSGGSTRPSWLGGYDLRLPRWPLLVSASSFPERRSPAARGRHRIIAAEPARPRWTHQRDGHPGQRTTPPRTRRPGFHTRRWPCWGGVATAGGRARGDGRIQRDERAGGDDRSDGS